MLIFNLSRRSALAFSVVFRNSPNILLWKDSPGFSFRPWKLPCIIFERHYYILIFVRIVKKVFLFILAWICFVLYAPLYCRHPYQSRNHLMNSCLHLSIEIRIPYYHYVKSNILWCFKNQQFCQWVVVCNI